VVVAVSFQQAVTGALLEGRRLAESLMVDTCSVTREDPDAPENPVTGQRERVQVYAGRAKSQTYEAYEQTPEAGEHQYTVQRYAVHFPIGAFVPEVGDVVEWTACPYDAARVGTQERITAPFSKTMATAQRVFVDRMPS
jgi:hypothetical protein